MVIPFAGVTRCGNLSPFWQFWRLLATIFLPKIAQIFCNFSGYFIKAKILIFGHIKQFIFTLYVYILALKIAFDMDT